MKLFQIIMIIFVIIDAQYLARQRVKVTKVPSKLSILMMFTRKFPISHRNAAQLSESSKGLGTNQNDDDNWRVMSRQMKLQISDQPLKTQQRSSSRRNRFAIWQRWWIWRKSYVNGKLGIKIESWLTKKNFKVSIFCSYSWNPNYIYFSTICFQVL